MREGAGDSLPAPTWGSTALVAGWSLVAHLAFIFASVERATPISAFFFGDSLHFVSQSQHLLSGASISAGLPFHPPLTAWLLVPLQQLTATPEAMHLAAKGLMAVLNAATFVLFYRLIARRVADALLICLLLPLCFGELLLSAAVNSEAPYRLALLGVLALGWRRPLASGVLCGVASLLRAEHLPSTVLVLLVLALLPDSFRGRELSFGGGPRGRRRFALLALAGLLLVLAPYTVYSRSQLVEYNRQHAEELAEPLPTLVPVSFYGPLNFALAQREPEIYFSRRTLPPSPAGPAVLDPTYAPHQEAIVHGYRLGWREIAERPGRALRRAAAKVAHSFQALGYGWSWRDLPNPPRWLRRPVDMAHSPGAFYLTVATALTLAGTWSLRGQRTLLLIGGLVLAHRLAINVVFFPYLRSMMVAAPFFLMLQLAGAAWLARRMTGGRTAGEHAGAKRSLLLLVLLIGLAAFHLGTVWLDRRTTIDGERDAAGSIIDDRTVELAFEGFR